VKINRCPKCGREPSVIRIKSVIDYGVEVECYDCGLRAGVCLNFDEAVTRWNELTEVINK